MVKDICCLDPCYFFKHKCFCLYLKKSNSSYFTKVYFSLNIWDLLPWVFKTLKGQVLLLDSFWTFSALWKATNIFNIDAKIEFMTNTGLGSSIRVLSTMFHSIKDIFFKIVMVNPAVAEETPCFNERNDSVESALKFMYTKQVFCVFLYSDLYICRQIHAKDACKTYFLHHLWYHLWCYQGSEGSAL